MLALGWWMGFLPRGEEKFFYFQLHKSIGITILLLSLMRLGWRLTHTAPPLPASMPMWEQRAAHIGHVLLYVVMIGMPLSGWAMVSAESRNIPLFCSGFCRGLIYRSCRRSTTPSRSARRSAMCTALPPIFLPHSSQVMRQRHGSIICSIAMTFCCAWRRALLPDFLIA